MNLSIFFRALAPDIYQHIADPNSFFHSIQTHAQEFPNYEEADIAIVGLTENRGTQSNPGVAEAADVIRKALYKLKRGSGDYNVVDLGNLSNGHSLEETYLRIKEVCETLLSFNTLPVLIGGSHDLDYGQYQAYESLDKLVNVLCIDARIDIEPNFDEQSTDKLNLHHLHKILMHEPNFLLNYSHLAYQSYLVDPTAPVLLEKFYFDTYRLGLVNQNISAMEPVIRHADMLSFDIGAISSSEAPGSTLNQPFGLTGQEACQFCWYAGHSEKLTAAGFYEYDPSVDDDKFRTASVIAIMVWYLIEGYYHRTYEDDFASNDFIKYIVPMASRPAELTFYKAKKSEKWWMEVPNPQIDGMKDMKSIVPCDPSDYHTASQGELPDRWIQHHAKFL